MVELIKDALNSIFTKKSHKEGFLKSGHICHLRQTSTCTVDISGINGEPRNDLS